jgi:hypothetical protein
MNQNILFKKWYNNKKYLALNTFKTIFWVYNYSQDCTRKAKLFCIINLLFLPFFNVLFITLKKIKDLYMQLSTLSLYSNKF